MFIIKDMTSNDTKDMYYCEDTKEFSDLLSATIYTINRDTRKFADKLQKKCPYRKLKFVEFVDEEIQSIAHKIKEEGIDETTS